MWNKLIRKIKSKIGILEVYVSETHKVRNLVLPYCTGHGCDIGFGGDKIKKTDCLGIDYAKPYAKTGHDKVDIACDISNEKIPVDDNTFDFVYSSHLIEDFEDTNRILIEFIRILQSGGNLILVFPDQQKYEQHCLKTGQPLNSHHVHADMGLNFIKNEILEVKNIQYDILFESDCEIDYNVIIILKIHKWEV
ncbi:MAG: class I SAM-dependent methyltransferase [Ferruginibacter sp.]|nr:class I SAM-dependent methyltransferase [Ferruginibacter sp.]